MLAEVNNVAYCRVAFGGIFMLNTKELIEEGRRLEAQGRLDEAYEAYHAAAEAGDAEAMLAVGNLYFHKNYKGIPKLRLISFPWQKEELMPDLASAYSWYRRAAEAGSVHAMNNAGLLLHMGAGCEKDDEESVYWLRKAAVAGHPYAAKALKDFFGEKLWEDVSDEVYDRLLAEFCEFVEQNDMENAMRRYVDLINGTDNQLCRLGLRLAVGRYNKNLNYHEFPYPQQSSGRSCSPIEFHRIGWESWLIVNLAAFPDEKVTLCLAPFMGTNLRPIAGVEVGSVVGASYDASSFGWLESRRKASILNVGAWEAEEIERNVHKLWFKEDGVENYRQIHQKLDLQPKEAMFYECQEKEYSVEIAWIHDGIAEVIYRYTIGGYVQGTDCLAEVTEFRLE